LGYRPTIMKFRTPINSSEISQPEIHIDYQSKIVLIGSCFVENIGQKLSYFKFNTTRNPFGILFNPISIEKAIHDIVKKNLYTESDLILENEIWHSLHHHSDFSNIKKEAGLQAINQSIEKNHEYIKSASHLIITLGTAWVYHHIKTDQLVANCHKIPQNKFEKRLLSIDEIIKSLKNINELIRSVNPNISITITLSPVRHLKDGMINNSRSKAHLLSAIHEFIKQKNVYYFPSYEIVMDDLRDYRFFEKDMLHSNEIAIDYIWNLYKESNINSNSYGIMKEVESIQNGIKHRPFNPDSAKHQEFIRNLNKKKRKFFDNYGIHFCRNAMHRVSTKMHLIFK